MLNSTTPTITTEDLVHAEAMSISAFFPAYGWEYSLIVMVAQKGLTITLFPIGAGLSLDT